MDKIKEILDSEFSQEKIMKEILFNPIGKSFLKEFPAWHDIINTYDYGLDHINDIVKTQKTLDENLNTGVQNTLIHFKFYIENVRIFGPNTLEHKKYSIQSCSAQTPNEALKKRMTYCALLIGDIHYSYQIINISNLSESPTVETVIPNKYCVNIPIPIGSKYCILNQYDPLTLIRSGEEMEGIYGYFIIQGFPRYLIPYYQKPYNAPIILRNDYDNQLARMEGLYSAGLDYENSYHVIASILRPKQAHFGRGINQIPILDFVFSLQMDDKRMNKKTIITRKKELINIVPIKYLFYAFGCSSDLEMIKYICPDLNDYGLIHAIRQACLQGKYHIEAVKKYLSFSTNNGYLKFDKPLDTYTANYLVGEIILSEEYKTRIKNTCKNDFNEYKREVVRQVKQILRTKFMPGIGKINCDMSLYDIPENEKTDEQRRKISEQEAKRNRGVCFELGLIVKKLYLIGNEIEPTMDRISLLNRRIRHGQQIENEFKGFHSARIREVKVRMEDIFKKINSASALNSSTTIKYIEEAIKQLSNSISINQSTSLLNAFKGTVSKDKSKIRAQLLTPKNQSFLYGMIREIVISTETRVKGAGLQWEHRVVHPSHLYFIDPVYSPESGPQVGRYQQPTIYTYLTTGSIGEDIYKFIKNNPDFLEDVDTIKDKYIIKLNGSTIGYIKEFEPVEKLYDDLMEARAKNKIVRDCSITLKHKEGELDIWTDEGRLMTIFVNVKNCFKIGNGEVGIKDTFLKYLERCQNQEIKDNMINEGLENGFITLFDSSMAVYNANVAETIETFMEKPWLYNMIALPLHILSYPTSLSLAVSLNAGVRGVYSSNHMKQAMGLTFRYPQMKYLGENNILLSPQIPLVRTYAYDIIGYNQKPMGENVIIAFMVYVDNQEDSFIFNRSSIENGLFAIDSFTVLSNECKKQDEIFEIPDDRTQKIGNVESYLKLDPKTCLPKQVGDRFYTNDVLIAKIIKINNNSRISDSSTINEMPDGCHPKEANTRELRCISKDEEINNNTHIKMVVMGQRRCALPGDKFNSCHAQKGTVGRIYDSQKMPYTASGIRPDIIFSPMSIFRRITCGQIYEAYAAKLSALLGCPIDSTPFQTIRSMDELEDIYKRLGLDPMGYEDLYDPESGRLIGKVFVGVMHYQRQQHLVENKFNVRSIDGDFDKVSGLAVKGRKRKGGQSIDRMTVDSINSSGAVYINHDLHINQGAKMEIAICGICNKQYTYYSKQYKCWFCSSCGRHDNFIIKEVMPAEILINHIFTGMHFTFEYRETNDKPDLLRDLKK